MTIEELDHRINEVSSYLNLLLHKKCLMEKIEEGRKVSAEILTEKLLERLCERKEK
jgi:hypothetical protein